LSVAEPLIGYLIHGREKSKAEEDTKTSVELGNVEKTGGRPAGEYCPGVYLSLGKNEFGSSKGFTPRTLPCLRPTGRTLRAKSGQCLCGGEGTKLGRSSAFKLICPTRAIARTVVRALHGSAMASKGAIAR